MRIRVLVTGATGFVGCRLVARLEQHGGYEVIRAGRNGDGISGTIPVELTSDADCRRLMAEVRPSVIIHLAAQSSVALSHQGAETVWSVNFDGTRSLAQAARASNAPVRFIFASSAEVYGRAFNLGRCGEDTPIAPLSPYARSKAACEMVLRDLAGDGLNVIVLRLFNHTGTGQDRRFVVPDFVAQLTEAEASIAPGEMRVGNLDAQRDFTDVEDVIDAYMSVLSDPDADDYAVYNVGSGTTRSIREILDELVAQASTPIRITIDPARLRPSEIPVAAGAMDRFRARYDWRANRPFAATLASMLKQARDERRRLASSPDDKAHRG